MLADHSVAFVSRSMYQHRKKDPGQDRGGRDMKEVPQIGCAMKLSSRIRRVVFISLEEGQGRKEHSWGEKSDGKGRSAGQNSG